VLLCSYYVGVPALAGATIPRTTKTVISCCTATIDIYAATVLLLFLFPAFIGYIYLYNMYMYT